MLVMYLKLQMRYNKDIQDYDKWRGKIWRKKVYSLFLYKCVLETEPIFENLVRCLTPTRMIRRSSELEK